MVSRETLLCYNWLMKDQKPTTEENAFQQWLKGPYLVLVNRQSKRISNMAKFVTAIAQAAFAAGWHVACQQTDPAPSQWHSVDDSLPEKGIWLVYGASETSPPTMRVDEYDSSLGWTGPLSVTHWRELPDAPEEMSLPPFVWSGVAMPDPRDTPLQRCDIKGCDASSHSLAPEGWTRLPEGWVCPKCSLKPMTDWTFGGGHGEPRIKLNPYARQPRQCTVHECTEICVYENKGTINERWTCPVHGLIAWPA